MRDALTRRELLESAAVMGAAGALAADAGCAGSPLDVAGPQEWAARLDPAAADAVLASLDARLAWIEREDLPDDVLPASRLAGVAADDPERERCRALVRKAARSLYATGRFIDLPDELKAHPGVQAKVRALRGDMDDAVLGMTDLLERMTPDDHRRVQRCLRDDPAFAERLASYLERPAVEDGIPFKRRFGMRASLMQLGSRMATQSPALLTDPMVRKVRKIQARPRPESEQLRVLAARMGEETFWQHQEKMAGLQAAWAQRLGHGGGRRPSAVFAAAAQAEGPNGVLPGNALKPGDTATVPATQAPNADLPPAPPAAPADATQAAPPEPTQPPRKLYQLPPGEPPQEKEEPGEGTISTGATMMGFGAGSVVLGLGFWGLSAATGAEALIYPALFFGVTLGPILLVTGLIVLLVGLGIKAAG